MKGTVTLLAALGTFSLPNWATSRGHPLEVGDPVRVRRKLSPLSGHSGTVAEITLEDPYGPYLVQFDSGLQFRYRRNELVLTCKTDSASTVS